MAQLFSEECIRFVPYESGSVDIATILSQINDLRAEVLEQPHNGEQIEIIDIIEEIIADNLYE